MTGIDISSHNGYLDYERIKKYADFVVVRAGYGTNSIDGMADYNLKKCNTLGIPVGAYWFSYAHDKDSAKAEAKNCCNFLSNYRIELPVAFDFEYDSERYVKNKYGIKMTESLLCEMANAFFNVLKQHGYTPMLYTNPDYISRGYKKIIGNQLLWLAEWRVAKPSYNCYMWQMSSTYRIDGINCNFDVNKVFTGSQNTSVKLSDDDVKSIIVNVINEYLPVAKDVINGVYGNGDVRKARLKAAGYDPIIVQSIVNKLVQ